MRSILLTTARWSKNIAAVTRCSKAGPDGRHRPGEGRRAAFPLMLLFHLVLVAGSHPGADQPDEPKQVCSGERCLAGEAAGSGSGDTSEASPVCEDQHCAARSVESPPAGDAGGGMTGASSGGGQQRKEWKDADLLRQCLSQMDDPEMCQMMIKVLLPPPSGYLRRGRCRGGAALTRRAAGCGRTTSSRRSTCLAKRRARGPGQEVPSSAPETRPPRSPAPLARIPRAAWPTPRPACRRRGAAGRGAGGQDGRHHRRRRAPPGPPHAARRTPHAAPPSTAAPHRPPTPRGRGPPGQGPGGVVRVHRRARGRRGLQRRRAPPPPCRRRRRPRGAPQFGHSCHGSPCRPASPPLLRG